MIRNSSPHSIARRFRGAVILTAMLASLGMVNVRADDEVNPRPGLSLGLRGAYHRPLDASEGNYFGGVQARLHLSPAIGIEGSVDYRRNKFADTTVHTYPLQASLLLYLIPNRLISPFLVGGAGWYYSSVEAPASATNTQHRFGVHAGGGLQVWLNSHWSLDGTYRYIWVEDLKSKDASLRDKDFKDSGDMATLALNFHF